MFVYLFLDLFLVVYNLDMIHTYTLYTYAF